MKVLLLQPPATYEIPMGYTRDYSRKARSILPPLGLLYLAGYLQQRHEVHVIDMMLTQQDVGDIPGILNELNPDLVGVTAVIGLWPGVVKIVRNVKHCNAAIRTVVGGPNATQYPAETLSHPEIDFVIVGLGQAPLMELCDQLEEGKSGENIENCYVQNRKYDSYQPIYSDKYRLDNFPLPDRCAVPYQSYQVGFCPQNPSTTMITSMGCPFQCAFCPRTRPRVQLRDVTSVVEEMATIQALGIRSVLFQDELFTLKPQRVRVICEALIEQNIQLHWTVKSRIDCIHPWMPQLMKEAGCFNIHFGIESGNDETLQRMKKGYRVARVRETVQWVKMAGLSCTGNFMLAYPGEDEHAIYQTIEFARELDLDLVQFALTMDPPGTELFDEALSTGRQYHDPWSALTINPEKQYLAEHFASERFSSEQLLKFLDEAYSRTRTLFDIAEKKDFAQNIC